MNKRIVLLLLVVFICHLAPAVAQDGFVMVSEATNTIKKKKKEGKWVEYRDAAMNVTENAATAPYYSLTIYDASMPVGMVRWFYKNNRLMSETPYSNGVINGLVKSYYENGKLKSEGNYQNGTPDGKAKQFYETGRLQTETTYVKGLANGAAREYYENGQLKKETLFSSGKEVTVKKYDENGNEVK